MIDEVGGGDVGQPIAVEIEDRERQRLRAHRPVSRRLKRSITFPVKHRHGPSQEIGRNRVQPAVPVQVPQGNVNGRRQRSDHGGGEPCSAGSGQPDNELVGEVETDIHDIVQPVAVQVSGRECGGAIAHARMGGDCWERHRRSQLAGPESVKDQHRCARIAGCDGKVRMAIAVEVSRDKVLSREVVGAQLLQLMQLAGAR